MVEEKQEKSNKKREETIKSLKVNAFEKIREAEILKNQLARLQNEIQNLYNNIQKLEQK